MTTSLNDKPAFDLEQELLEKISNETKVEFFTHQQLLINQYMHLNIQLLSKKLENLEHAEVPKEESNLMEIKSSKKKM
jgi:hypothetical protein